MKYLIQIDTDNDAFADSPERETARILRDLADKLERGWQNNVLFDINGNRVGVLSRLYEDD